MHHEAFGSRPPPKPVWGTYSVSLNSLAIGWALEGKEGRGKERNGGRRRGGTPHFWKQIVATAQLHMHLLLFGSHKLNKVSHTN